MAAKQRGVQSNDANLVLRGTKSAMRKSSETGANLEDEYDEEASAHWSTERWLVEFRSAAELHTLRRARTVDKTVHSSEAHQHKMGEEVFIPNRRQTVRPMVVFDTLSGEATTPVVTVFKAGTTLSQAIPSTKSQPGVSKKWQKKILAFTNTEEPVSDGDTPPSTAMQEELQEWLDNLQWRMKEAELNSPPAPAPKDAPSGRRMTYAVPKSLHYSLHLKQSPTSSDTEDEKVPPISLLPGSAHRNRSRSITSVDELVITDHNYMEQLQRLLQEASISSLQERVEERKVKEAPKADPSTVSIRKKSYEKTKARKKSSAKVKSPARNSDTLLSSETNASASSTLKTDSLCCSRKSTTSRDTSSATSTSAQEDASRVNKNTPSITVKEKHESYHNPTISVQDSSVEIEPNLAEEPLWNMLDNVESVDEIYKIAEALVLPPARPDPVIPAPLTPPAEMLQWVEDLVVYSDEEEEEDLDFVT